MSKARISAQKHYPSKPPPPHCKRPQIKEEVLRFDPRSSTPEGTTKYKDSRLKTANLRNKLPVASGKMVQDTGKVTWDQTIQVGLGHIKKCGHGAGEIAWR